MVFSSLLFIFVFLPISLALFYGAALLTRQNRTALSLLLTALSLAFYLWGSGRMLILLIVSILFNWRMGEKLVSETSQKAKRRQLILGIAFNASALLYFKYCRFILDTIGFLVHTPIAPNLHPYLPVGISFYTFMAISYLVENYRSPRDRASLVEFGTFLSLFPHLVAGPIVRFNEIAEDLRRKNSLSIDNFSAGVIRFAQGLGMKVLIADNLSPTVDRIFSVKPALLGPAAAWLGAVAYTFQIYFDFAGYSAMAIGLALMLGFHFPENFNRPYMAQSVTEFWKRWHMSLSRWLRDYLYIPLGGNRKGGLRTYANLFIVFVICGLWHGAAWTFVVWGMYQGALLIVERMLKNRFSFEPSGLAGVAVTFFLTVLGWILFRSESIGESMMFFKAMFSPAALQPEESAHYIQAGLYTEPMFLTALLSAALFSFFPIERFSVRSPGRKTLPFLGHAALTALILIVASLFAVSNSYKPFIYFRF